MPQGKVKWFNSTKGYGFIEPENNSSDVFLHISAIEHAGYANLNTGQVVRYELQTKNGKSSAVNLQLV